MRAAWFTDIHLNYLEPETRALFYDEIRREEADLLLISGDIGEALEATARQALEQRHELLVLTHVPPFGDAWWHEGKISTDEYLPHFTSRAVGERLGQSCANILTTTWI